MPTAPRRLPVLVRGATWLADRVIGLDLVPVGGTSLPPWEPGAHIDVVLPSGLVRQYSLYGSGDDPALYQIAVLLEPNGRGGSKEVHGTALVGRQLEIRPPRNHFGLVEAPAYVFVAGGIGITPILPMISAVAKAGKPWTLVYGGRTRTSMALLPELALVPGGAVDVRPQDERGLPDLAAQVARAPDGAAFYCCGPEGLLRAMSEVTGAAGLAKHLHVERFGAPASTPPAATPGDSAQFEVELRTSGITVTVPPDRSVLDVVSEVVPTVMSSCSEGYCGTCETRVLEGTPDHRDSLLSDSDKATNETMLICVSRSRSPKLVLDL
ncbi:PDR/VanB family oxidoreductase [Amycolatopsis panacis]|uniref:Oxidoreductase n=1 Tax=Amycolatopsis panacis TaxID=2340917 RepID=A0A419I4N4_9PSEU|nr:PDR/VanB family oxidoreductase [Amycolatopsis panacis]RJQ85455.1 oxidoreductase [Amycolatopsis panacis]